MRKSLTALVSGILVATAAGCGDGSKSLDTRPLTEEEKKQIQAHDKMVEDEERGGSGTATKGKGKK